MPSPNTTPEPEKPYSPKVQAAYLLLLKALEDYNDKVWKEFEITGETTIYTPPNK